MDSNKVSELTNIINSLCTGVIANQSVSTSDKEGLTRLRNEFESTIRDYQRNIDSVNNNFIGRLQSKTDEIRRRIDNINEKIAA